MFNNNFEVFIDMILLHSLFLKASKKGLWYSVLCCVMGISIYTVSFDDNNNLRVVESFATATSSLNAANNINQTTAVTANSANSTNPTITNSLSISNLPNPPLLPPQISDTQDNKDTRDLSLGSPFYDSKSSILLNTLNLISAGSASKKSKELQIFYERGIIYDTETVHNIGYYIEESKPRTAFNESSFDKSEKDSKIDETITFAKGTGFFIAADSDRIGWNAYDQVYDNSQGITKYLGVIYFSANEIPEGKLSDLANKAGIYEYQLYADGSAHRNIWLWPTS